MGTYQPASYYDDLFQTSAHYALPADRAPWYPIWRTLRSLLPPDSFVIDIGCGPGHFASLLEFPMISGYVGLDFSPAALRLARERAPFGEFRLHDLLTPLPPALLSPYHVYVISETLEHLPPERSLSLLAELPPGALVLGSLPAFDDTAHTFHVSSLHEIPERFGALLSFDTLLRVDSWFLFRGSRIAPMQT